MAQAKTLTQNEIDQVLRYIATKHRYSIRNRTILLTSFYSGMRVGEIASSVSYTHLTLPTTSRV